MKEFWDKVENDSFDGADLSHAKRIREFQGLFFWERGGKEWAWMWGYNLKDCILQAKQSFRKEDIKVRDFLDCLACLGEDKVKELIKEGVEK